MKETINVNIAQQAFTMDMDAYSTLTAYLDDIAARLPESDTDTISDVESRIAEIFHEKVRSSMMVITLGIVDSTMAQIGGPENFGETSRSPKSDTATCAEVQRRFYRSYDDRSIAGVCGGLAKYFNLDPTLIRIAAVLLIFAAGSTLWLYLILWLVVPYEPQAVK